MEYNKLIPMLAAGKPRTWSSDQWLEHIEKMLPLIASPKIDGIRCVCKSDGHALSRSLKNIPNKFIREYFYENRGAVGDCVDGELVVGDTFQMCTSGIMSHNGKPDFTYWVFDAPSDLRYVQRVDRLNKLAIGFPSRFMTVPTCWIHTPEDLAQFEEICLAKGFEGVMLRTPSSPYKFGRSTQNQGWLLKLKRFATAEARVIGTTPMYKNTNPPKIDGTGHQVRSTEAAGMVPLDVLGKFTVVGINNGFEGVEFNIGSGLNRASRECFWEFREKLVGQVIEFKYQEHGTLTAPRTPIFLRFRNADTL